MAGRPIRFLALTGGGWIALRVVMMWPAIDSVPSLIDAVVPPALAKGNFALAGQVSDPRLWSNVAAPQSATKYLPLVRDAGPAQASAPAPSDNRPVPSAPSFFSPDHRSVLTPPLRPTPFPSRQSRLSGSAWLIARGGSTSTSLGSQLGASQAGARILYALDNDRHLSLAARIATPLHGRGQEAALGVEWRPGKLPVRIIAEQRFAIDGGQGGPALFAVGGIGPTRLAAGFNLEAYGQTGGVKRDRVEGFADGAARITRPIARVAKIDLDLGLGAWGGVQRAAGRLDVGPTIGARIPIVDRAVRVTLDWRARIAGSASPGSGLALSVGTDF